MRSSRRSKRRCSARSRRSPRRSRMTSSRSNGIAPRRCSRRWSAASRRVSAARARRCISRLPSARAFRPRRAARCRSALSLLLRQFERQAFGRAVLDARCGHHGEPHRGAARTARPIQLVHMPVPIAPRRRCLFRAAARSCCRAGDHDRARSHPPSRRHGGNAAPHRGGEAASQPFRARHRMRAKPCGQG